MVEHQNSRLEGQIVAQNVGSCLGRNLLRFRLFGPIFFRDTISGLFVDNLRHAIILRILRHNFQGMKISRKMVSDAFGLKNEPFCLYKSVLTRGKWSIHTVDHSLPFPATWSIKRGVLQSQQAEMVILWSSKLCHKISKIIESSKNQKLSAALVSRIIVYQIS